MRSRRKGGRQVWSSGHSIATITITTARKNGMMKKGMWITNRSTNTAPIIVDVSSTAPMNIVRGMHINIPPATCTTPVNTRNHCPSPIRSKV